MPLRLFHHFGLGPIRVPRVEFLFSSKAITPFLILYSLAAIVGATMDLGLMRSIANTFNGLMSIPNLAGLFLLSGTVVKLVRESGIGAKHRFFSSFRLNSFARYGTLIGG